MKHSSKNSYLYIEQSKHAEVCRNVSTKYCAHVSCYDATWLRPRLLVGIVAHKSRWWQSLGNFGRWGMLESTTLHVVWLPSRTIQNYSSAWHWQYTFSCTIHFSLVVKTSCTSTPISKFPRYKLFQSSPAIPYSLYYCNSGVYIFIIFSLHTN